MKQPPRFVRDEWPHSFDPTDSMLDPASPALARTSVVARERRDRLIERPRDLIETPQ
jgi:hypothetical protein